VIESLVKDKLSGKGVKIISLTIETNVGGNLGNLFV
jgi:hypothetical protein